MTKILDTKIGDPALDNAIRNVRDAVKEHASSPFLGAVFVKDVTIADGAFVPVSHGLGRTPNIVIVSPPRNPTSTGRVVEVRDGFDRTKMVKLHASGWGATITVDVLIV